MLMGEISNQGILILNDANTVHYKTRRW